MPQVGLEPTTHVEVEMAFTCAAVMVVVDASDKRTREKLNPELLRALSSNSHIPAILLLNKVLPG